ncbi:MAG: peptidylprolyl isomerase [Candidatus Thermoplasmatota archaeon]|nr:peptidylprolyl isomerase [Candidatus Thermoplasmatota archaeon]
MGKVQEGDTITVEYTGRLEDGTVFDSSDKHEEPLEFTVGEGKIIQGFDKAVIGMEVGEEKEITLPPEDAYGQHNPELVRDLPRNVFPEDQELQPGMVFMMALQDGRQVPVRIAKVAEEQVTVDLNSPLAGKTLNFTIKVVGIAS